ncbi:MAG: hypothetical protein P8180_04240 [Gammaproteobacteria bacterium]|jgi:hypothetical protein
MAHIIDLATGQVCGPAADEQPAGIATECLQLELQHAAAPEREALPADLLDADAARFIATMEKF